MDKKREKWGQKKGEPQSGNTGARTSRVQGCEEGGVLTRTRGMRVKNKGVAFQLRSGGGFRSVARGGMKMFLQ